MAYVTRTKDNPGDVGRAADQQQSVDNEEYLKSTQDTKSIELIERVVLTATATDFDFTSIPATFRDLKINGIMRIDRVNATDGVRMLLNNDSGNNYDWFHSLQSHSSVLATGELYAGAYIRVGDLVVAANAPADVFSRVEINIPSYVNTVTEKVGHLTGNTKYQEAAGGARFYRTEFFWRSTAAISRITLTPVTGPNFIAGSEMSLYGIL